jgi:hypothetical protein
LYAGEVVFAASLYFFAYYYFTLSSAIVNKKKPVNSQSNIHSGGAGGI